MRCVDLHSVESSLLGPRCSRDEAVYCAPNPGRTHFLRTPGGMVDLCHDFRPVALSCPGQPPQARQVPVACNPRLPRTAPSLLVHIHMPRDDQADATPGQGFVDGEHAFGEHPLGAGRRFRGRRADETVLQAQSPDVERLKEVCNLIAALDHSRPRRHLSMRPAATQAAIAPVTLCPAGICGGPDATPDDSHTPWKTLPRPNRRGKTELRRPSAPGARMRKPHDPRREPDGPRPM